jgi:hypothetical protein
MLHPMNDGTLDVLILGPMGAGVATSEQNCVRLKAAVEALLGRAEFTERLRACGYQRFSVTAPEHLQGNRIANEVFRELDKADLVLLDLSSRPGTTAPSPNVMYELALVHALGLPFMLISSTTDPAPFYVAHDRVRQAAYEDLESTTAELHGPFAAYLDPKNRQNFADNAISGYYDGAAIIDISAAAGLAAGYYDNFVHRVLREGNGYLARSGGQYKRLITVLPADLDSTAAQQIEDVAALAQSLGLQLESTELKLAESDIRGLAIKHIGPVLIDVPSTVYALRRSPRLLKHLQESRDDLDDGPGGAEKKTHQRLLRQFRQSLLDHLRRDRALTPIRDKAFECISVADLPERLRQLAG